MGWDDKLRWRNDALANSQSSPSQSSDEPRTQTGKAAKPPPPPGRPYDALPVRAAKTHVDLELGGGQNVGSKISGPRSPNVAVEAQCAGIMETNGAS